MVLRYYSLAEVLQRGLVISPCRLLLGVIVAQVHTAARAGGGDEGAPLLQGWAPHRAPGRSRQGPALHQHLAELAVGLLEGGGGRGRGGGGGKSGWVPDAEFETACGSWILDLKLLVGPVMRWMCYITIVLDY